MTVKTLSLTNEEVAGLAMLYAAPFAPEPGAPEPPMHPVVGIRPRYHHEIGRVLEGLGVRVKPVRELARLETLAADANFVFSLYSRAAFRNCEVYVASLCERIGIAHMGAPPNVRALAEDKYLCKALAAYAGIPVPVGRAYVDAASTDVPPEFPGPYFVKYRFGSASEDIDEQSAQPDWPGARERVLWLVERGKEALVERLVPGTDLTVPVLGGSPPLVLPAAEEVSELRYGIATFRQKRFLEPTRRRRIVTDPALQQRLGDLVARLCRHLLPFDYRRETGTDALLMLEVNIACNLGSSAAIVQSAASVGLSQADVVGHIVAHSIRRQSLGHHGIETENL